MSIFKLVASLLFAVSVGFSAPSTLGQDENLIFYDPIEPDGEWVVENLQYLSFLPSTSGVAPTAGAYVMHFNNLLPGGANGTNSLELGDLTLEPGRYVITLDVGNFNNYPFVEGAAVALMAGGEPLFPTSIDFPEPDYSVLESWELTYEIDPYNSFIGQPLSVSINVPQTGRNANGSFDNLRVFYESKQLRVSIDGPIELECESDSSTTFELSALAQSPYPEDDLSTGWFIDDVLVAQGANVSIDVPLGETELLTVVSSLSGLSKTISTKLLVKDTVAPEVSLSVEELRRKQKNGTGRFYLDYEVSDACDPSPTISAIAGVDVSGGAKVAIKKRRVSSEYGDQGITFSVTATDQSQNTTRAVQVVNQ